MTITRRKSELQVLKIFLSKSEDEFRGSADVYLSSDNVFFVQIFSSFFLTKAIKKASMVVISRQQANSLGLELYT